MIVWKARKELSDFLKPENKLQISIQTAWQTLAEIQIGKIKIGDNIHEQLSQPEGQCKKIAQIGRSNDGRTEQEVFTRVVRNF